MYSSRIRIRIWFRRYCTELPTRLCKWFRAVVASLRKQSSACERSLSTKVSFYLHSRLCRRSVVSEHEVTLVDYVSTLHLSLNRLKALVEHNGHPVKSM